eukprot:9467157-Pyramimonas_sp.AAC.1
MRPSGLWCVSVMRVGPFVSFLKPLVPCDSVTAASVASRLVLPQVNPRQAGQKDACFVRPECQN